MGTIKTTNIEPIADNGTVTLGSSGDTITVPTGVTVAGSMANTPGFNAYQNAALGTTLTQNTATKVVFDSEYYDTDSAFSSGRFTVPSGKAGKYFFTSSITMRDAYANISIYFYKNGSRWLRGGNMNSDIGSTQTVTGEIDLSVGDYVEVFVQQNQSTNRAEGIVNNATHSYFSGHRLIGV